MGYKDLIKRVQDYSGFSDSESKDALQLMVESLSVHLTDRERRDFASQLPEELQDIALAVWATEENSKADMVIQFMQFQHIDENHARAQIKASWQALKSTISGGEAENIKAQLPSSTVGLLT